MQIVAQQHQQRRLTFGDKFARHIEEEIAAVHGFFEGLQRLLARVRPPRLELVCPAVKHLKKSLTVVMQTDRLKHDGRHHTLRHRLDQAHDVRATDTHPGYMEAIDTQVIQQGELVCCVDMPTVRSADGSHGLTSIALIHRNHTIVWRELLNGIPRGSFPEGHCRAHASRRNKQNGESGAIFFIIYLDIVPLKYWHVCASLTVVHCRAAVGYSCTPVPA